MMMKKHILVPLLLGMLMTLSPLAVSAGATDSDGFNTNEVSPNREARDMSTEATPEVADDGEDKDFGWIGLLGLLGLAGLMKRDRGDHNRVTNR
jgi:hypothetical protein